MRTLCYIKSFIAHCKKQKKQYCWECSCVMSEKDKDKIICDECRRQD